MMMAEGCSMNHCGTQKIETKRLLLRQFTMADAADLLEL